MTFEEYLVRFRLLQHGVEKDEKSLALIRGDAYRSFLRRFGNSTDPSLSRVLITEDMLRRRLEKRQRLCERYAARLARAIARIPVEELRDYALFHYLYGLTHEDIAEQSFFCVRTVYRHGKKAREELKKRLLEVQPKLRRTPPGRYRVQGRLPKGKFRVDSISRSVAAFTARRRGASHRQSLAL